MGCFPVLVLTTVCLNTPGSNEWVSLKTSWWGDLFIQIRCVGAWKHLNIQGRGIWGPALRNMVLMNIHFCTVLQVHNTLHNSWSPMPFCASMKVKGKVSTNRWLKNWLWYRRKQCPRKKKKSLNSNGFAQKRNLMLCWSREALTSLAIWGGPSHGNVGLYTHNNSILIAKKW